VLIVDDEEPIRNMLAMFVTGEGFLPLPAGDGEEGLALFRQERPTIVITDVRMPRMDGLTLVQHLKEEAPETYVVLITGHGDEAVAIAALRAGAADYLKKPLDLDALEAVLKKFAQAISARGKIVEDLRALSSLQLTATMVSDPYRVPGVVAYLLYGLQESLRKSELADLQLVLSELLLNAIEHGNLEISGDEKRQALMEDQFAALVQARRSHPVWGQRRVEIELSVAQGAGEFSCCIRDEGNGFDWRALPQEIKPEHLVLPHGRGVLLSRLMVDRLEYNEKGNAVTLVKQLQKGNPSE
jgi:DNA-binding response OmpR family regulator